MMYSLKYPMTITSRLMPGIRLDGGNVTANVSLHFDGTMDADRKLGVEYWIDYVIDGKRGTYHANDLHYCNVFGVNLPDDGIREACETLLFFMGAAAESYRPGTCGSTFNERVDELCYLLSGEISLACSELEGDDDS